jgi:hypothetical protein
MLVHFRKFPAGERRLGRVDGRETGEDEGLEEDGNLQWVGVRGDQEDVRFARSAALPYVEARSLGK